MRIEYNVYFFDASAMTVDNIENSGKGFFRLLIDKIDE